MRLLLIDTESRMVVAGARGVGKRGARVSRGQSFLQENAKVLETDGGDGCATK